jgi:hypothetical protein
MIDLDFQHAASAVAAVAAAFATAYTILQLHPSSNCVLSLPTRQTSLRNIAMHNVYNEYILLSMVLHLPCVCCEKYKTSESSFLTPGWKRTKAKKKKKVRWKRRSMSYSAGSLKARSAVT